MQPNYVLAQSASPGDQTPDPLTGRPVTLKANRKRQSSDSPDNPGRIGLIVIGRNEGNRLQRCLESVRDHMGRVVYVDSASTDRSVLLAQSFGASVVKLDDSTPLSAARARNEGFKFLMDAHPDLRYLQFIDGDCELIRGWLDLGQTFLDTHPDYAIVCGRLRERQPERSIYNRLCDLEWERSPGDIESCGGISMMRVRAFQEVGGFDASVLAGEEAELCHRLRQAGGRIFRIDVDMTIHDAAMTSFGQWWTRHIRSGYGGLEVEMRFAIRHFMAMIRRAWFWGVGVPLVVICVGLLGAFLAGSLMGCASAALVGLAFPAEVLRLATRMRRKGTSTRIAVAYGVFTLLAKWPQLFGQLRYIRHRLAAQPACLIEYKHRGSRTFVRQDVGQERASGEKSRIVDV